MHVTRFLCALCALIILFGMCRILIADCAFERKKTPSFLIRKQSVSASFLFLLSPGFGRIPLEVAVFRRRIGRFNPSLLIKLFFCSLHRDILPYPFDGYSARTENPSASGLKHRVPAELRSRIPRVFQKDKTSALPISQEKRTESGSSSSRKPEMSYR